MSDGNSIGAQLPCHGRSVEVRATEDGKFLFLKVALDGDRVPSSTGKTQVIATASFRNLVIGGQAVSGTFSAYVPNK